MKLYYFYTLKALWDGQGKIKMYYGMPRVKKQLSGRRPIPTVTPIEIWRHFYLSLLKFISVYLSLIELIKTDVISE